MRMSEEAIDMLKGVRALHYYWAERAEVDGLYIDYDEEHNVRNAFWVIGNYFLVRAVRAGLEIRGILRERDPDSEVIHVVFMEYAESVCSESDASIDEIVQDLEMYVEWLIDFLLEGR